MTHRHLARLHAALLSLVEACVGRLRLDPQRGQGTVEYVALILLVAGVLAAAVGISAKANLDLGTIVAAQLKAAVAKVSGSK